MQPVPPLRLVLANVIAGRRLLQHPFYRRWSAGELSVDELRAYAAQYRHIEAATPGLLRNILEHMGRSAVRASVERTLADETGDDRTPSHLDLFERFASALDAPEAAGAPATAGLISVLDCLTRRSSETGLAALSAYELQSPEISATKADGLRSRYGLDGSAVAFWDTHASADLDHGAWLVEALESSGAKPETVEPAARAAADAWWTFLDEREASR